MQQIDHELHTDQVLLQQLSQNDQAAFTAIYERYWKSLFREAMNVLRSQKEAEDCVQELFVSIWNRRQSLSITSLKAYLNTAIRYQCIDRIEKDMIRGGYLDDFITYLEAHQTSMPSIEEELYARELAANIDQVMDKMPDKMREVFRLSRQEQLTHREIATRLQISEETVKKQIYLALKILKSNLGNSSMAMLIMAAFVYK
ncbi:MULTISPECIES: RNA polymerase sigma-70 factor [Niastella]|uniref:RNA polymerase sigma-70 factor n=1 Tax=Niastella soli TaxID=2821487 RepID=A0ABS3YYG7_9BACT|nr:RNA polymerase sigma-70 factor [Niastella soli]MBO9202965.1 RNA polymerase sigma-70 factor [Niastella soli]